MSVEGSIEYSIEQNIEFSVSSGLGGGGTFYVDQTSGLDGNDGTSPAKAWKTLGYVETQMTGGTVLPGHTVRLKAGETWTERFTPPTSGTLGNLITFDRYGTGADPIIDGTAQTYAFDVGFSIDYIGIKDIQVINATSHGLYFAGNLGGFIDGVTAYDNGGSGINGGLVQPSYIRNCTSYHNTGAGILILGPGSSVVMTNNICYENTADAMSISNSTGQAVSLYNNTLVDSTGGAGLALIGTSWSAATIRNNIFAGNSTYGISLNAVAAAVTHDIDYNSYFDNGASPFDKHMLHDAAVYDLAGIIANTDYEDAGLDVDPLFSDSANDDYRLMLDSPCYAYANPTTYGIHLGSNQIVMSWVLIEGDSWNAGLQTTITAGGYEATYNYVMHAQSVSGQSLYSHLTPQLNISFQTIGEVTTLGSIVNPTPVPSPMTRYTAIVLQGGANDLTLNDDYPAEPLATVDGLQTAILASLDAIYTYGPHNVTFMSMATLEGSLDTPSGNYVKEAYAIDDQIFVKIRAYDVWSMAYARACGFKLFDYNTAPHTPNEDWYSDYAYIGPADAMHPSTLSKAYTAPIISSYVTTPSTTNLNVWDALRNLPNPKLATVADIDRIAALVGSLTDAEWASTNELYLFDQSDLDNARTNLKDGALLAVTAGPLTLVTGGVRYPAGSYSDLGYTPAVLGKDYGFGVVGLASQTTGTVNLMSYTVSTDAIIENIRKFDRLQLVGQGQFGQSVYHLVAHADVLGKVTEYNVRDGGANANYTIYIDGVSVLTDNTKAYNFAPSSLYNLRFNALVYNGGGISTNTIWNEYAVLYLTDGTTNYGAKVKAALL